MTDKIISKKTIVLFIILSMIFTLSSCYSDGKVIGSLPAYKSKEFYSDNTVQDFTDFGKYTFSGIETEVFNESEYFSKVTKEDIENIKTYEENFSNVISEIEKENPKADIVLNYSFDISILSETDYFYLKTREGMANAEGTYGKFDNYSVYVFDTESNTLYYFHCDI